MSSVMTDCKKAGRRVIVGMGTCGLAAGAQKTWDAFQEIISREGLRVSLESTACIGMCYREVLVEVHDRENGRIIYGEVDRKKAVEIAEKHLKNGTPVREYIVIGADRKTDDETFFAYQKRIVLRNAGLIDPRNIDDYLARGGYKALEKLIREKIDPDSVIKTVKDSGLRGRGGAGFSTGLKWEFARKSVSDIKYVICNGDEGDPGAFMDRSVLEGDPHSVLEGMAICGYAIGAREGIIYVRAEYPLAVQNLHIAIEQARKKGFLGSNLFGSDFTFDVHVKEGAGAFVCGEETALMASIEGRRGMPRLRPPFPAVSGLWGKPTNINNVETFASIPWIIANGADAYSAMGTEKSRGTKVFALAGKIRRGGLIEVPMGITLREVVEKIGGGTSTGLPFKAVQMGGPSGGCIPESLFDTPVDYESLAATGAIMGSGGMVVMDSSSCMVDIARFFLKFTQEESCGKCTFCRVGTKRMLEILDRITSGEGRMRDLDDLSELAEKIKMASLCGLGQTAPNPVLTTLRYFRDEYIAHVEKKKCPAHYCRALITYSINEKCAGCAMCVKVCPTKAISGELKKKHVIDGSKCVKCGMCRNTCRFNAISVD